MLTFIANIFLNSSSTAAISHSWLSLLAFRSCIVLYLFSKPFRRPYWMVHLISSYRKLLSVSFHRPIVIIVLPCAADMRPLMIIFCSFQVASIASEFAIYALLFPKRLNLLLCELEIVCHLIKTKCFNRIEIFSLHIFYDSELSSFSSKFTYDTRNLLDFSNPSSSPPSISPAA